MKFLLNVLIGGILFAVAARIVPGVAVDGIRTAIIAGLVLSLVNATIGSLLRFFSFPINFLTFGLVGFVITVLMILLTDSLVTGFDVNKIWNAIVFAIILGLVQGVFGNMKD
jgi:putative membrane protein